MEINRENLLSLIKSGIKRHSLTMSGLENQAKVPRDTIRDFMRGKTQVLRADKLQKILHVLEPTNQVRVYGTVGASARIMPSDTGAKRAEELVDCPPGYTPSDVVAVRVKGDGMLPIYHNGWLIYYSRRGDLAIPAISGGWQVPYAASAAADGKPFAEFLGKPCVIGLADDHIVIGTLKRSASRNSYDLINYNTADLHNIKPQWAAKIIYIKTE